LHEACNLGHERIVQLLIKAGANVNADDAWGNTPLQYAAGQGSIELIRLLVSLLPALHCSWAVSRMWRFFVGFFGARILTGPVYAWFWLDTMNGQAQAGAVVDVKSKRGRTPLHRAAVEVRARPFALAVFSVLLYNDKVVVRARARARARVCVRERDGTVARMCHAC
jgi:ankyrin repeat protein